MFKRFLARLLLIWIVVAWVLLFLNNPQKFKDSVNDKKELTMEYYNSYLKESVEKYWIDKEIKKLNVENIENYINDCVNNKNHKYYENCNNIKKNKDIYMKKASDYASRVINEQKNKLKEKLKEKIKEEVDEEIDSFFKEKNKE